ncbi:MAG: class II fructose-bisphosphate aldolase [Longicatena sp.]
MFIILVNGKKAMLEAKQGRYAIPASNVINLESIHAVLEAATMRRSPLIVALAEVHLDSISLKECSLIVHELAASMKEDIILHFDHGFTKELVLEAIDAGFTSVMIDGSSLPYEENVKITKEIVAYAHERNVCVEAEIGHVGGGESYIDPELDDSYLTSVEEAKRFVADTNVDTLAISVGTAHGEYKGTPHLEFERLKEINDAVEIPLVLHGGSGSGDDNLRKATKMGISKVNICTDLFNAARDNSYKDYKDISYYDSCFKAKDGYRNKLIHYYEVFETKQED